MIDLTFQERSCLLRAVRQQMAEIAEQVMRLHDIGAVQRSQGERALADVKARELECLASAVRKLWLASKDDDPPPLPRMYRKIDP